MIATRSLAAAAALVLASVAVSARAIPGQTVVVFEAWAKDNPVLHHLEKKKSEMSGLPYYTATFHEGAANGNFLANIGENGIVTDEAVAIDTTQTFDILKHRPVALAMLHAVYGQKTAEDFQTADDVGTWTLKNQTNATSLYRGQKFGYELTMLSVKVIPAAQVDAEAKMLAQCVKEECGD